MPRLPLLLLLALAACRAEAPPPEPPADAPAPARSADPPTPFDAAEAVFDTVEPPEQVVRFPPPPPTPPPTRPRPRPSPPPPPPGPAGSCDVRGTEGYCFAFTGDGWTPAAARTQCDAAPEAAFAPAACPREGRIATCTFERPSAPGREIVYTYYAPYDPALAELACPGTFARVDRPGS